MIIPFSAETKQGREEIYALLDRFVEEGNRYETACEEIQ